jgi:hypothetical protein
VTWLFGAFGTSGMTGPEASTKDIMVLPSPAGWPVSEVDREIAPFGRVFFLAVPPVLAVPLDLALATETPLFRVLDRERVAGPPLRFPGVGVAAPEREFMPVMVLWLDSRFMPARVGAGMSPLATGRLECRLLLALEGDRLSTLPTLSTDQVP